MDHRTGTCTSCGARFRVPASFAADKAKCKKCGGVVEIGPAEAAAQPVPARKPAPRPAAGAAKAATPAPRPAKAPAKPTRPVAATKPVARKPAATRRPTADEDGDEAPVRKGSRGARRGGSRRGREKKGIGAGAIAALAFLLLLVGAGGWYFLQGGDDSQAAEKDVAALDDATTGEQDAGDASADATDAPTAAEDDGAAAAADEEEEAEEPEPEPEPAQPAQPEDVTYDDYPDFPPFEGTTEEEWERANELVATFIDPNAGARGNRAKDALLELDRKAFPAIINHFKQIDLSTDEGRRNGDLVQRLLQDICNGQNFDWRYTTEAADVVYNKKVVIAWWKAWDQAKDSDKAWARLAKREMPEEKPPEDGLGELEDF